MSERAKQSTATNRKQINLALQGGGSHGAFTWGVLDRLLEDEEIELEAISGTSAGAMNAAVVTSGFCKGKYDGAREDLERFWSAVSEAARFSPLQRSPIDVLFGNWSLGNSPMYQWLDMSAKLFSPYDLNPAGDNPLAALLADVVDFDLLNKSPTKLFITATNVETGQARVFRNPDISLDVLLASACLPNIYKTVEIDGVPYWDGGYSGNPSLGPLVRECSANDTVLVQINPVKRPGIPKTSHEISSRLNEISFNSSLVKELRMMSVIRKDMPPHQCEASSWGTMRMHLIASDVMLELDHTSKMNAEWDFMTMLRDKGREAAGVFLEKHRGDIGKTLTLDLEQFAPDYV
ncbi:patatin-like phospholipase family protein [Thalassospira tepidiphila]|uniref:Alpha/beta hydrolase n=3 Tax=Thalassospira TaxID=168934 RepID=A0A853L101_9PROT|nr:patatin-like phospholipase family protein [Thalassospira tepidiphila]NJB74948.1 NTE family protein [Thalassospira tepidiphila]OAZ10346.1 alpha/beta hydrolase [Thalassospira tepidiphila MCCC 1A03514]